MTEQVRAGLDGPALATGEPADLVEQSLDLEPEEESGPPADLAWEADPADALEQAREVGYDEERDPDG